MSTTMTLHVTFVVLILLQLTAVLTSYNAPPQLSGEYERHHAAAVGTTVRLVCPVDGRGSAPALVDWWKDGRRIHDGWVRHRLINGTLRIRSVLLTDAGIYICDATNGFGSATATFLLHVYPASESANYSQASLSDVIIEPPSEPVWAAPEFTQLASMRSSRQVSLVVDESTLLHCEAHGSPLPHVVWYKEDAILSIAVPQSVTWTLVLDHVTLDDGGVYTCVVYNDVGTISFSYNVAVLSKPAEQSPVSGSVERVTVRDGQTVKLRCPVRSADGQQQSIEVTSLIASTTLIDVEPGYYLDGRPSPGSTLCGHVFEVCNQHPGQLSLVILPRVGENSSHAVQLELVDTGRRLATLISDGKEAGRWQVSPDDHVVSELTIVNTTRRDAGLFMCYDVTSTRHSAFYVFQLIISVGKSRSQDTSQESLLGGRKRSNGLSSPLTALIVTLSIVILTVTGLLTVYCVASGRRAHLLKPTSRHLGNVTSTAPVSAVRPPARYAPTIRASLAPVPVSPARLDSPSFYQTVCSDGVYPTLKSSWASTAIPLSQPWSTSPVGSRCTSTFPGRSFQMPPTTLQYYSHF